MVFDAILCLLVADIIAHWNMNVMDKFAEDIWVNDRPDFSVRTSFSFDYSLL